MEYEKIYHLCFPETSIPQSYQSHNELLRKAGAFISLKYRRGPLVDLRDVYLVFWYEEGKVWCSRVNTKLYGLDWQFFKDGHEMVECKDWDGVRLDRGGYVIADWEDIEVEVDAEEVVRTEQGEVLAVKKAEEWCAVNSRS